MKCYIVNLQQMFCADFILVCSTLSIIHSLHETQREHRFYQKMAHCMRSLYIT